jgi:uncharacterized protein YegP (UPF0339 family)
MAGKFVLKKASNGQFHFNLQASNGQVILSSETYKEKRGAVSGIESVRTHAPQDGRYERKESGEQYFFVLKASNGQTLGRSELYKAKASMESGIESVKKNAPDAKVDDQAG